MEKVSELDFWPRACKRRVSLYAACFLDLFSGPLAPPSQGYFKPQENGARDGPALPSMPCRDSGYL